MGRHGGTGEQAPIGQETGGSSVDYGALLQSVGANELSLENRPYNDWSEFYADQIAQVRRAIDMNRDEGGKRGSKFTASAEPLVKLLETHRGELTEGSMIGGQETSDELRRRIQTPIHDALISITNRLANPLASAEQFTGEIDKRHSVVYEHDFTLDNAQDSRTAETDVLGVTSELERILGAQPDESGSTTMEIEDGVVAEASTADTSIPGFRIVYLRSRTRSDYESAEGTTPVAPTDKLEVFLQQYE